MPEPLSFFTISIYLLCLQILHDTDLLIRQKLEIRLFVYLDSKPPRKIILMSAYVYLCVCDTLKIDMFLLPFGLPYAFYHRYEMLEALLLQACSVVMLLIKKKLNDMPQAYQ